MEAKFINPVLHSMVNVLSTMAKLEPKPEKPSLKKDDIALGEVTGIMSMAPSSYCLLAPNRAHFMSKFVLHINHTFLEHKS